MRYVGNNKRYIKLAALILVIVFLFFTALLGLELWETRSGKFKEVDFEEAYVTYKNKEYVLKENIETFLVLGLDKFEGNITADSYNNDQQADFIMLLVFDNDAKKCTLININRDSMTNVNVLGVNGNKIDTVKQQIALAHTYGNGRNVSCRNTADAVSELLNGIKIDHYASLKLDAVTIYNDLLGGVEVTVEDDFSGIDEGLVKGETVNLTGEQALHFIRTRYGLEDSSNSTRMKRQNQYMEALYKKTKQAIEADESFIAEASIKLSDYLISDRSVTQLQELVKKIDEYELSQIKEFEGKTKQGEEFMEFYPDVDEIKETVISLFYRLK